MSSRAPTRKQLSRGKHPKPQLLEKPIQNEKPPKNVENKPPQKAKKANNKKDSLTVIDKERKKEMQELEALKKKMADQRKKQLLLANEEEDRNIKMLEKRLKLNKKKSKGLPKMFVESGLDYILEMCDPEQMKEISEAEKQFMEFGQDLALPTEEKNTALKAKESNNKQLSDDDSMSEDVSDEENSMEEEMYDMDEEFSDSHSDDSPLKRKRNSNKTENANKKLKLDKKAVNNYNNFDDLELQSEMQDEEESDIDYEDESEMDYEEESVMEEITSKNRTINTKVGKKNNKTNTKKTLKNVNDDDLEELIAHEESYSENEIEDGDSDLEEEREDERSELGEEMENEERDLGEEMEDEESDLEEKMEEDSDPEENTDKRLGKMKNKKQEKKASKANSKINIKLEKENNKMKRKNGKADIEDLDEESDLEEEIEDEESDFEEEIEDEDEMEDEEIEKKPSKKNKNIQEKGKGSSLKNDIDSDIDEDLEDFEEETEDENQTNKHQIKGAAKVNSDGTWEDIYGRLHAKDGTLINKSNQKYIPPAVRAKMTQTNGEDKETLEKLNRLKKQLKGLLNRLALSNMHNVAKQVENLYMSNSRNDMNETLGALITESIVSQVLTPERLLMEHVLLIAILHANIGTEVGAHFLQLFASMFNEKMKNETEVGDKTLDNIIIALAQMYNFKVFDSKLMHEILNELSKEFTEKNVDCILHILRNIGFVLRKEDPLALKNFILDANKKAASVTDNAVNGSRLRFLLDVLTAIKNNNMTKIPNYDDSYSEHLKKNLKNFIRKGNYVTPLNISLEDLLKAEEKGKWWVVGSAWVGKSENQEVPKKKSKKHKFSEELLEKARKMRMNTDTKRDIFCNIISAEDIDDAFEKLLHLGLTKNQEREIINVILQCCLGEHPFNPYYAHLAQRFCEHDRKHMMTLKFSIWDKLKAIEKQNQIAVTALAGLLTHLFLHQGLPISTLKVIEFTQMDANTTSFLRQIFLGILLHSDTESCIGVFKNVAQSDKLKMFRESLRLFLQIFVRKNLKSEQIDEKQRDMLKTRSKMIERLLVLKDTMNL